ncbi:elongation factor P [Aquirufa antheringensis]|jgi:elongation factor P|uniref:Elongation factor P n=1 Tax=Aquirufa antheringensis TaxID=2516559 RepID=A0A4V2IW14_9BACT|nr:elongation factor P [Aquirufa antheringensis]MCE4217137.1 elongation factor P [Pseudarcicella sp. GAP-15]MCZ2478378.1 elongation factor P [Aquirufa antheringensis]MCZ2484389.1 elongation factor P [Aquirufa antheringensis]MCZ2487742.1 elongation factor P [Aquirufa antheringensis]MCZ2489433.1 elongation factor P [Aquirufa antheringensis]
MATTADIKNGMVIKYNDDLYSIIEFLHVKPGKGPAFVRTKLRSLTSGKVIDNTFNSGVAIYPVRVERRKFQFIFKDEFGYNFMDQESFEQILLNENLCVMADLMKEGQEVEILINTENDAALSCELPPFVELKVTYTEPGVRGDTANSPKKPATVETGATITVPIFIEQDEVIKVDTRTYSYAERVK